MPFGLDSQYAYQPQGGLAAGFANLASSVSDAMRARREEQMRQGQRADALAAEERNRSFAREQRLFGLREAASKVGADTSGSEDDVLGNIAAATLAGRGETNPSIVDAFHRSLNPGQTPLTPTEQYRAGLYQTAENVRRDRLAKAETESDLAQAKIVASQALADTRRAQAENAALRIQNDIQRLTIEQQRAKTYDESTRIQSELRAKEIELQNIRMQYEYDRSIEEQARKAADLEMSGTLIPKPGQAEAALERHLSRLRQARPYTPGTGALSVRPPTPSAQAGITVSEADLAKWAAANGTTLEAARAHAESKGARVVP